MPELKINQQILHLQEKKQTLDSIDQQLQTEMNELTYKLTLDQNEEAEKLRKVNAFIFKSDSMKCGFLILRMAH